MEKQVMVLWDERKGYEDYSDFLAHRNDFVEGKVFLETEKYALRVKETVAHQIFVVAEWKKRNDE